MNSNFGSAVAPQGLTGRYMQGATMASKAMRLKLSAKITREVSERRQVGDAESMLNAPDAGKGAWWRDVGMEEGL